MVLACFQILDSEHVANYANYVAIKFSSCLLIFINKSGLCWIYRQHVWTRFSYLSTVKSVDSVHTPDRLGDNTLHVVCGMMYFHNANLSTIITYFPVCKINSDKAVQPM